MTKSPRASWQSQTGFLLAALGSAIGLGNIWRFPYMAYRNGGGAFLVPYFVALFVVGIPLLMLEFGLGHYFRRAVPQALYRIHPRFAWIGWWSVSFVMFGIVTYYAVVMAWCALYLLFAVTQPWGDAAGVSVFFDERFLGSVVDGRPLQVYGDGGFQFGRMNWGIVAALCGVWLVNWLITRRELQRGVELANKIFIPLLVALTAVLVAWSWNLPGAEEGRQLYLRPDWSLVFRPQTWSDAFSQIFFTLSIGFGIMVAYASYLPPRTDIPSSAFLTATGNCAFSVFAALAVFSAIGMLADLQGMDVARMRRTELQLQQLETLRAERPREFAAERQQYEALRRQRTEDEAFQQQMSSFGLVFKTYPAIITSMGPVTGRVFGVLFFLSLLVAGISSSISIVEGFMAALNDQFGWSRGAASTLLCAVALLLGLVYCTQAGIFWLDLVDHFITSYGLILVAVCESLVVGWFFASERLRGHLDAYRVFHVGRPIGVLMRLMITAVLLLTWFGLAQMETATLAATLARFALLISVVVLWISENWLDFDIRLLVPAMLLLLMDQALVQDVTARYGGYPWPAILGIGVGWLAATLLVAALLHWLASTSPSADDEDSSPEGDG